MKKLIILFCIAVASPKAFSQSVSLDIFNTQKSKISKAGFVVLGSWAAANIIYGSIATGGSQGSNKYFHQMNVMWGGVNLGFAVMGYLGAKRETGIGFESSLKKQITLEKTFLFNAGLDLTYIASGLYLQERSKNVIKNSDKFKGYGESVLFQGGGLLIFDVIMYTLHNRHGKQLYKIAEKVQLTAMPGCIGVFVRL